MVFACALQLGYTDLVLGALGCGTLLLATPLLACAFCRSIPWWLTHGVGVWLGCCTGAFKVPIRTASCPCNAGLTLHWFVSQNPREQVARCFQQVPRITNRLARSVIAIARSLRALNNR